MARDDIWPLPLAEGSFSPPPTAPFPPAAGNQTGWRRPNRHLAAARSEVAPDDPGGRWSVGSAWGSVGGPRRSLPPSRTRSLWRMHQPQPQPRSRGKIGAAQLPALLLMCMLWTPSSRAYAAPGWLRISAVCIHPTPQPVTLGRPSPTLDHLQGLSCAVPVVGELGGRPLPSTQDLSLHTQLPLHVS